MTIVESAPAEPPIGSTLRDVLSRREVAEFTGIAYQTLAHWATEGKGPKYRRAGQRCLYLREDVIAWLRSLETAS